MTTQTPDAVREAADPRVEIAARALGLHRFPGGEGRYDPPTRWPSSPRDTLSGRDGTVPLTWEFAEQCRADVRAILAALDSRAGDAGEAERLRKALERARSDLHLVTLHGAVRPMWEEAKAARDRVHEVLVATPAPAVDARKDTIAFVQEWLMSSDYPADTWTHEFAAAIDARCKPAVDAGTTSTAIAAGETNPWREAVIDGLIVAHIYNDTHDTDPRKALHDLICWEVAVALDPAVSERAAALVAAASQAATPPAVDAVPAGEVER